MCSYPFAPDQPLQIPDWERFVGSIVGDILAEQSPRQLLVVRAKLYQLLINCIPASVIMKARSLTAGPRLSLFVCSKTVDLLYALPVLPVGVVSDRRFVWS